jgi:hypothetical protein
MEMMSNPVDDRKTGDWGVMPFRPESLKFKGESVI